VRVLLDTCVVSELQRPAGDVRVKDAIRRHARDDVFLSVITVGELRNGISLLPWGRKRPDLEVWFTTLQEEYLDRILSIEIDIARAWGELTARARANGNTLAPAD
jgi:predicted nucleic acid-binding protein